MFNIIIRGHNVMGNIDENHSHRLTLLSAYAQKVLVLVKNGIIYNFKKGIPIESHTLLQRFQTRLKD